MKRCFAIPALLFGAALSLSAQLYEKIPSQWKWLNEQTLALSYSGQYSGGEDSFTLTAPAWRRIDGVEARGRFSRMPIEVEGAHNLCFSPDSSRIAYTLNNDLYVVEIATEKTCRLTFDGSDVILNGYASWVYYEEIFGRSSNYRAFWWSPDSRRLAYYRFDDSQVPMFPIYSPFGQDGSLRQTHYPKAGEKNPEVRVGFISVDDALSGGEVRTVWADFDPQEDGYFGKPFWGRNSDVFYLAREPRIQNSLDLYAVRPDDGSKEHIYHETYPTWLDWIDKMLFTDAGFYMVRSFETGWQQIYFLSYDGKTFRRITDGENWDVSLQKILPDGSIAFLAKRDSQVRSVLYKVDGKGKITALTDPDYDVARVQFSPEGRYFAASLSNLKTPTRIWAYETAYADLAWKARAKMAQAPASSRRQDTRYAAKSFLVADMAKEGVDYAALPLPEVVWIEVDGGLKLPATVVLPEGFDPAQQYPVHVDIYGGPDTPLVRDRFQPYSQYAFYSQNGIIQVIADCRASGHNGRAGLDQIYKHLATVEVQDFISWARYFQSLPYVRADKIGVEGFSFGGTMTTLLLLTAPDAYHYGIAGGGVYDWMLYDTHYTERFMSTPEDNPEGYRASVLQQVDQYPVQYKQYRLWTGTGEAYTDADYAALPPVMLKLTHGSGDDNVHMQNTLQLLDALQRRGMEVELMIYPDGMHGYRGYQGAHFTAANWDFWLKYLKN